MTSLPEADALTAGPPLAHAHGSPTASSRWVPNRPAASRPLLPLHRGVPSASSQPRTAAPSSGTTTYPPPGSPPRAARKAARLVVRRAPGRELQRFLPGPRLWILLTGQLANHSTEEEVVIGL